MPALVIPLIKWALVLGGVVFGGKFLLNQAEETTASMTPNLVQLGAVAILGLLVWRAAK